MLSCCETELSFSHFKTCSDHFLSSELLRLPFESQPRSQAISLTTFVNSFCFVCLSQFARYFFFLVEHRIKMEPLLYPLCYQQQHTNIINTIKGFPGCAHLSKTAYLRNYTNESWKKCSILHRKLGLPHHKYKPICKKAGKIYTSSFFIVFEGPLLHFLMGKKVSMQNFTSTEQHFLHTHPKAHCRHMVTASSV